MINRAVYPNLVTLGNLFLGYLSIILTMQGDFTRAAWLIVIASMMDALDGLVALALSDQAVGEIFNLGSRFEMSIKDLAYKIKELTDSKSELEFIPYEQAWPRDAYEDLVYRAPDLEKIRTCVGYDPKVDLNEALVRIIQYYER